VLLGRWCSRGRCVLHRLRASYSGMLPTCNQHATSMQPACNQHATSMHAADMQPDACAVLAHNRTCGGRLRVARPLCAATRGPRRCADVESTVGQASVALTARRSWLASVDGACSAPSVCGRVARRGCKLQAVAVSLPLARQRDDHSRGASCDKGTSPQAWVGVPRGASSRSGRLVSRYDRLCGRGLVLLRSCKLVLTCAVQGAMTPAPSVPLSSSRISIRIDH